MERFSAGVARSSRRGHKFTGKPSKSPLGGWFGVCRVFWLLLCCLTAGAAEAAAKRAGQRDPRRAAPRLSLRRESALAARLRANRFAAAVSVVLSSPQVIHYFPIT